MTLYATAVSFLSAWLFDRKALKSLMGRLGFMLKRFGR